jgi:hypothetical protein
MTDPAWREGLAPASSTALGEIWIPVGVPGFAGDRKAAWQATLDARFGPGGWRIAHLVRGAIVPPTTAILEYEAAYRQFIRRQPGIVRFLTGACGNVYDNDVTNVLDDDYLQPQTASNHYQDIAVRRVIAELVDDPDWPWVERTEPGVADLVDLGTGVRHRVPRASGFRGDGLCQIRDPESPGYFLSPAVVPVHDPALITTLPSRLEWYHREGCAHLSVEAFWQMSKVVEVRYDRFLASADARMDPLAGL